jgi:hypothetical protein
MAEVRNGAENSAPTVETDAVSMNCRLESRNNRVPLSEKGSSFAATALAWPGAAAERRDWGPANWRSPDQSVLRFRPPSRIDKCLTV